MEITQMKFFLEVAKNQHITKSAERLHISQPSLTQAIHRLEDSVGVPLFEQKGRNIVITEYGKFLQEKLTPIIQEIDNLPYILQTMAKHGNETIHLNVLAVSTLITNAIIEYKQTKKNVNFQLLQNSNSELYDMEVSTKLFYQTGREQGYNKKTFSVTEKIVLAVPNNEKYADKTSISLSEVVDEGFISLFGSKQFRLICDKICGKVGFRPNVIFESDNPAAVINMIASNLGIGFYPEFSWGKIKNKNVKTLEIIDAPFRRDIVVTANLNKTNNIYLLDFYNFLEKYITKKTTL